MNREEFIKAIGDADAPVVEFECKSETIELCGPGCKIEIELGYELVMVRIASIVKEEGGVLHIVGREISRRLKWEDDTL